MVTGTVKWLDPIKGFGFIRTQGGGQDVFVHASAVGRVALSSLSEGQEVELEIISNRGGVPGAPDGVEVNELDIIDHLLTAAIVDVSEAQSSIAKTEVKIGGRE